MRVHPVACCALIASSCVACTPLRDGSEVIRGSDGGRPAGEDAGPCPLESGEGTLAVFIDAPKGLRPEVYVGSQGNLQTISEATALTLSAGSYVVTAKRLTQPLAVVGRAYTAVEEQQSVCVRARERTSVSIQYEIEPGSTRLFTTGVSTTYHTASYAPESLEQTGKITPQNTISDAVSTPSGVAFDPKGNLWISDRSGKVFGYVRETLGVDRASSTPDVLLEGKVLCEGTFPCGPEALAFDDDGDLWLALPDAVVRIAREELVGKNEPPIKVRLTGESIDHPCGLAFNAAGDLWVLNKGASSVVRFARERLLRSDNRPADNTLLGQHQGPVFSALSNPQALAIDSEANLWVSYLAQGVLARFTKADQTGNGAIVPALQLELSDIALLSGLAFDESGHLWTTGMKALVRIDRDALSNGNDPIGSARRLEVDGYVEDLAFDPPAHLTPLAR